MAKSVIIMKGCRHLVQSTRVQWKEEETINTIIINDADKTEAKTDDVVANDNCSVIR